MGSHHQSIHKEADQGLDFGAIAIGNGRDMDVALGLADRVTVLHQGQVILEGTPDEVRANAQVRDVYFGHA